MVVLVEKTPLKCVLQVSGACKEEIVDDTFLMRFAPVCRTSSTEIFRLGTM